MIPCSTSSRCFRLNAPKSLPLAPTFSRGCLRMCSSHAASESLNFAAARFLSCPDDDWRREITPLLFPDPQPIAYPLTVPLLADTQQRLILPNLVQRQILRGRPIESHRVSHEIGSRVTGREDH